MCLTLGLKLRWFLQTKPISYIRLYSQNASTSPLWYLVDGERVRESSASDFSKRCAQCRKGWCRVSVASPQILSKQNLSEKEGWWKEIQGRFLGAKLRLKSPSENARSATCIPSSHDDGWKSYSFGARAQVPMNIEMSIHSHCRTRNLSPLETSSDGTVTWKRPAGHVSQCVNFAVRWRKTVPVRWHLARLWHISPPQTNLDWEHGNSRHCIGKSENAIFLFEVTLLWEKNTRSKRLG